MDYNISFTKDSDLKMSEVQEIVGNHNLPHMSYNLGLAGAMLARIDGEKDMNVDMSFSMASRNELIDLGNEFKYSSNYASRHEAVYKTVHKANEIRRALEADFGFSNLVQENRSSAEKIALMVCEAVSSQDTSNETKLQAAISNSMGALRLALAGGSTGASGNGPMILTAAGVDGISPQDFYNKVAKQLGSMLEYARLVKGISAWRPKKHTKKIIDDPTGPNRSMVPLQLDKLDKGTDGTLTDFVSMDPKMFMLTAGSKKMWANTRIISEDDSQFFIVLVDVSGSMKEQDRIQRAIGVVWDRLVLCESGDMIAGFATFNTQAKTVDLWPDNSEHPGWLIDSHERAVEAMAQVPEIILGRVGGNTNTLAALQLAAKMVEQVEKIRKVKPHVIVITDDDGYMIREFDHSGLDITFHGMAVGVNPELQKLAIDTNGIYLDINL